MNIPDLNSICQLTVELTKLRQAECKHLCIENFAPELFGKLLREAAALSPEVHGIEAYPKTQANGFPWDHRPGAVNLVNL